MPPKGRKATSKTAKRPRDSSDSQSDDDIQQNVRHKPEEMPRIEISDEDSASSDQDDQQAREYIQKITELQEEMPRIEISDEDSGSSDQDDQQARESIQKITELQEEMPRIEISDEDSGSSDQDDQQARESIQKITELQEEMPRIEISDEDSSSSDQDDQQARESIQKITELQEEMPRIEISDEDSGSSDQDDQQARESIQKMITERQEETPRIDISDEDSASSDQDDQQARESIQKMITEFQGDLTMSYLAKRKQFRQDVKTSIDILNEKLLRVFKTQQREREMLRSNHSEMIKPLFQEWKRDVMKVGEEEDSFVNSSHQHAEILYNTMMAQKATIGEAKNISDQFLKNMQILEDEHKMLDAVEQNRLENEMEDLKKKLVTENQQQDLAAIESCLHSMFSEDDEEDML